MGEKSTPAGDAESAVEEKVKKAPKSKGSKAKSPTGKKCISKLTDVDAVRRYLAGIGAEPRGLKSAVVSEKAGRYRRDIVLIKFADDGTVEVSDERYAPDEKQAEKIKAELAAVEWPALVKFKRLPGNVPDMIKNADPDHVFKFRDRGGNINMVQVRLDPKDPTKDKSYIPWTYWSDKQWRTCEPDGPLPLFNLDKIKGHTTVFLHEGPKAAAYCQWMVDGKTKDAREALAAHPWGESLTLGAHVGWIGGALNPGRTDWSALAQSDISRATIVADNDPPGRSAVPRIAKQLRIPTNVIQFTGEFPESFDLADEFPESLFGEIEGQRHYTGPAFLDCYHHATWATDLRDNKRGSPTPVLRKSFERAWTYVSEVDCFVHNETLEVLDRNVLNNVLAPFSDASDTARLIVKAYNGRTISLAYAPDAPSGRITREGKPAINLFKPSVVRSSAGDPTPWIEFLAYMFPNENERREIERWCATLIARPDVRIKYAVLLVSETQGVGKTTLGAHVLAPLVGIHNVSFPGEADILSNFNDWIANKRLSVIAEIYQGRSWKAYNDLKQVITDANVTVNRKYQRSYETKNWVHLFASSNSKRPLKVDEADRRWLIPQVVETPWPREKFETFYQWLKLGGLGIIKHWAENFGDYIEPSEKSPFTASKKAMIEESYSEAQALAKEVAEAAVEDGGPIAIASSDVLQMAKDKGPRVYETESELRKVMVAVGMIETKERIKVGSHKRRFVITPALDEQVRDMDDAERRAAIRKAHQFPNSILEEGL